MRALHLTKIIVLSAFLLSSAQLSMASSEDPSISAAVAAIISSKANYAQVGAEVDKKDVILTGTVNTVEDATSLICRIAQLNGVEDIASSKLKSRDDLFSPANDANITSRITAKIGGGTLGTRVTTNAGVVLLVGSVPSVKKVKQIEAIVSQTEGVKCVASHLTVKQ